MSDTQQFNFDRIVDRHGSWCTQWDFVADRFGHDDLLPFTISDMDIPTAPAVIEALQQRVSHGVLGYSRWQHDDFLGAISRWYQQRFEVSVDRQQIVYGPSVIYMVAQMLRRWSQPGDGVVIHTPAYDAFYKVIEGNQRRVMALPLSQHDEDWQCDMAALEQMLANPQCKILLLCSPHNPTGKVWRRAELQQMAALCERYQVRVISDEIHMDMVMDDSCHIPWSCVGRGQWALFTSASKSFNIPALTGAYGFISDEKDRAAWFQALKNADGLSSPLSWRWPPISPPISTARRGWMRCAPTCVPTCSMLPSVSTRRFPRFTGSHRRRPTWHGLTSIRWALMMANCSAS